MIVGYSNEYATHIRAFVMLNSGCILKQGDSVGTAGIFVENRPNLEQAIALETHEFRLNLKQGDSVGNAESFLGLFCIFFLL